MSKNPLNDLGTSLGDYLREQRQSAQLSLRQLADLAGIGVPVEVRAVHDGASDTFGRRRARGRTRRVRPREVRHGGRGYRVVQA